MKELTSLQNLETEGFFIVIPRPIDSNTTENVKIPKMCKLIAIWSA